MKSIIKGVLNHSLYKNALLLMINSVVLSSFGFLFWTIVARFYSIKDVGLASTLISSLQLISNLSLAGFNIALIRYLPKSTEKNKMISSCFLLSGIIALFIGYIFILGLNIFSPKLLFLKDVKLYGILFIFFVIFFVFYTLIEYVFIALRKSKFVLIKNVIFSILKLIFSFLLIFLGAFGIFSSMAISAAIAFAASLIFLRIKFSFIIKKEIIKKMFKFSFGNYIANILQYAPALVLPLIITNMINPETTAYFYVALMIAALIFIIPTAVSHSLLAEGSHNANNIKMKVKKAFKFSYLLLVPSVIFVLVFGKYLLLLFGSSYSENASSLLQILALSALPFAINIIYITKKNIQHKIKDIILLNFLITFTIFALSILFLGFGLIGIGIAWLIGQLVGNGFLLYDTIKLKRLL